LPGRAALPAVRLLCVAPEALAVFAFNAGARSEGRRAGRNVLLACAGLQSFQLLTAAAYALLLGPLILLVYGAKFQGAIAMAFILLPGLAFQGCTMVADGYLRGCGRASAGVYARVVAAAVMCLTALVLYHRGVEFAVPWAASIANGMRWVSGLWSSPMVPSSEAPAALK